MSQEWSTNRSTGLTVLESLNSDLANLRASATANKPLLQQLQLMASSGTKHQVITRPVKPLNKFGHLDIT